MKNKKCFKTFFVELSKNTVKQFLFCVFMMIMLIVAYINIMLYIQRDIELVSDDFSWVYQIDNINNDEKELVVTGWAFELNIDATEERFEIYIYDRNKGKLYYLDTKYVRRDEVGNYFKCEYDYSMSGFVATIPIKLLDLEEGMFEIILRPADKRMGYFTSVFYVDNQMHFTNPENYIELDVKDTDLFSIVKKGILRVYRPEMGIYVYQYENELYWIIEEYYEFTNGDTFIEYQMDTTQKNKLPSDRIQNNWLWSNMGFQFSANELIELKTGKYRVAKCKLPTEYSITKIWTGEYVDRWIWEQDFRPWYELN